MQALRELATKLLEDKTVAVVIGWEEGPHGVRPSFASTAEAAQRLIFDVRCTHNLATYLSPRRTNLLPLGKKAVVVKGCDARAVAALLRESQLERDELVLIGVRCGGVVRDPAGPATLDAKTASNRCGDCELREPTLVDHLLGELPPAPPPSRRDARIAELDALPVAERWAF